MLRFGLPLAATLISTSALAPSAFAQSRAPLDVAQAEALFREGKALMDRGEHTAACPKLAESHRLAPGGGTVLTLALCYEGAGRTATAWATFFEAARVAKADGRADRRTIALTHIKHLEPDLSRIELVAPTGVEAAALELALDGEPLSAAVIGVPTPVDPGRHVIVAKAPKKKAFEASFEVGKKRDLVRVELGPLEDEAAQAPKAPSSSARTERAEAGVDAPRGRAGPGASSSSSSSTWHKPAAIVALAGGGVGLGFGTFFGLRARALNEEAERLCPVSPCANTAGVDKNASARGSAAISTAAFTVGLVAVAAGVTFLVLAPSAPAAPRSARSLARRSSARRFADLAAGWVEF